MFEGFIEETGANLDPVARIWKPRGKRHDTDHNLEIMLTF